MRVIFLGDIVGRIGRQTVSGLLPDLKKRYEIDFVIANSENATHGHGCSYSHYQELLSAGIDCLTSGNHFLNNKDIFNPTYDFSRQIRPANLHSEVPLAGTRVFSCQGRSIRVTNLLGRVMLDVMSSNPFDTFKAILEESGPTDLHIVDFHAEATGEKQAFFRAFDGKATLFVGTHTHVQTADERLLPHGSAMITDLGMCGAYESVIGDSPAPVIKRTWTGLPAVFTIPESGPAQLCGLVAEINDSNKVTSLKRIYIVS